MLRHHSDRTRRVLQCLHEISADDPSEIMGNDVLHIDFARGNVLWDKHRRIAGVVDWNLGIARGDRRFALVGLRRDLEWGALWPEGQSGIDDGAIKRLDDVLRETIEPALLRKYWAHWTLSMLHGVIPSGSPDWIELFLSLGERRLGLP